MFNARPLLLPSLNLFEPIERSAIATTTTMRVAAFFITLLAALSTSAQSVDPTFGSNGMITISNDNGDSWIREQPTRVLATSPEIMAIVMTRSASPTDNRVGLQLRRLNGQLLSCTQSNPNCDRVTVSVDPLFPQSVTAVDAIYVTNASLPDPPAGSQGFNGRIVVLANTELRTWLLSFHFQGNQLQLAQSHVRTQCPKIKHLRA